MVVEVFGGGDTYFSLQNENSNDVLSFVNGRSDVDGPLLDHVAIKTLISSIKKPALKHDTFIQAQIAPILKQSLEESLQDCIVENGKYLNSGGTCIEECFDGQTLIVYDWNEGYCCCKYDEELSIAVTTTPTPTSQDNSLLSSVENSPSNSDDSSLDCEISAKTDETPGQPYALDLKRIDRKVLYAFPNFIQNLILQNAVEFTDTIKNCVFDEYGNYLNYEGSCIGECESGKKPKVYDKNEGYCCCSAAVEAQTVIIEKEFLPEVSQSFEPVQDSIKTNPLPILNTGGRPNSEQMQNCMVDREGHFLNEAGSCAEECGLGKQKIVYDDNEGFCCCFN